MSFINDKIQFLRDAGDCIPLEIVRSENRMRSYESTTDARAWCDVCEDKRQHILELMTAPSRAICIGKYVPNRLNQSEERRNHILELISRSYRGMKLGKYVSLEVMLYLLVTTNFHELYRSNSYEQKALTMAAEGTRSCNEMIAAKDKEIKECKRKNRELNEEVNDKNNLILVCESRIEDVECCLNRAIKDLEDQKNCLCEEMKNLYERLRDCKCDQKRTVDLPDGYVSKGKFEECRCDSSTTTSDAKIGGGEELKEELQHAYHVIDTLKRQLNELNARIEKYEGVVQKKEDDRRYCLCHLKNSMEKMTMVQCENRCLKKVIEEMQTVVPEKLNGKVKELKRICKCYKAKEEKLNTRSQELSRVNNVIEEEMGKLKGSIEEMAIELQAVLTNKSSLEEELESAKSCLMEGQSELENYKSVTKSLSDENETLKRHNEELKVEITEKLQVIQVQCKCNQNENEEFRDVLENLKTEKASLETALLKLRRENNELIGRKTCNCTKYKEELETLRQQLLNSGIDNEKAMKEIDNLEEKVRKVCKDVYVQKDIDELSVEAETGMLLCLNIEKAKNAEEHLNDILRRKVSGEGVNENEMNARLEEAKSAQVELEGSIRLVLETTRSLKLDKRTTHGSLIGMLKDAKEMEKRLSHVMLKLEKDSSLILETVEDLEMDYMNTLDNIRQVRNFEEVLAKNLEEKVKELENETISISSEEVLEESLYKVEDFNQKVRKMRISLESVIKRTKKVQIVEKDAHDTMCNALRIALEQIRYSLESQRAANDEILKMRDAVTDASEDGSANVDESLKIMLNEAMERAAANADAVNSAKSTVANGYRQAELAEGRTLNGTFDRTAFNQKNKDSFRNDLLNVLRQMHRINVAINEELEEVELAKENSEDDDGNMEETMRALLNKKHYLEEKIGAFTQLVKETAAKTQKFIEKRGSNTFIEELLVVYAQLLDSILSVDKECGNENDDEFKAAVDRLEKLSEILRLAETNIHMRAEKYDSMINTKLLEETLNADANFKAKYRDVIELIDEANSLEGDLKQELYNIASSQSINASIVKSVLNKSAEIEETLRKLEGELENALNEIATLEGNKLIKMYHSTLELMSNIEGKSAHAETDLREALDHIGAAKTRDVLDAAAKKIEETEVDFEKAENVLVESMAHERRSKPKGRISFQDDHPNDFNAEYDYDDDDDFTFKHLSFIDMAKVMMDTKEVSISKQCDIILSYLINAKENQIMLMDMLPYFMANLGVAAATDETEVAEMLQQLAECGEFYVTSVQMVIASVKLALKRTVPEESASDDDFDNPLIEALLNVLRLIESVEENKTLLQESLRTLESSCLQFFSTNDAKDFAKAEDIVTEILAMLKHSIEIIATSMKVLKEGMKDCVGKENLLKAALETALNETDDIINESQTIGRDYDVIAKDDSSSAMKLAVLNGDLSRASKKFVHLKRLRHQARKALELFRDQADLDTIDFVYKVRNNLLVTKKRLKGANEIAKESMLLTRMALEATNKEIVAKEDPPLGNLYEELLETKETLEKERRSHEETVAMIRKQADKEVKDIIDQYNKGIVQLQQSQEELSQEQMEKYKAEIESLKSNLDKCTKHIECLSVQNERYMNEIAQLNDARNECKECAKRAFDEDELKEILQCQLDAYKQEIIKLRNAVQTEENKSQQLVKHCECMKTQLCQCKRGMENEIRLQNELDSARQRNECMQDELQKIYKDLEEFRTSLEKCKSEARSDKENQLRQQKAHYETKLSELTLSKESEIRNLKDSLKGSHSTVSTVSNKEKVRDVEQDVAILQRRLEDVKRDRNKIEKEKEEIYRRYEELKVRLDATFATLEATTETNRKYETEIQNLKRMQQNVKDDHQDRSKAALEKLEKEKKDLQTKYDRCLIELQELKRKGIKDSIADSSERSEAKGLQIDSGTMEIVSVYPANPHPQHQPLLSYAKSCKPYCLNRILCKILEEGFQSLTFDELSYLHSLMCHATANILGTAAETQKPSIFGPKDNADKITLKKRIDFLEMELMKYQKCAQEKANALHIMLEVEKRKLHELKNALYTEKQRNHDLAHAVDLQCQSCMEMQMQKDLLKNHNCMCETRIQSLMNAVEIEKGKVKKLELELHLYKRHRGMSPVRCCHKNLENVPPNKTNIVHLDVPIGNSRTIGIKMTKVSKSASRSVSPSTDRTIESSTSRKTTTTETVTRSGEYCCADRNAQKK